MTLTDFIPGLKGNGSRRAVDKVAELREENVKLLNRQAEADDFFALLMNDVVTTNDALAQEQERRINAEKAMVQAENVIRLRNQEIAKLRERLDVGVKAEHVIAKTQEFDASEVRARFATPMPLHLSPMARCNPGHVPGWVKDEQPEPAA